MAIASISEFVWNGILIPINSIFIFTRGLLEPIIRHLTADHPNFIYAWLCVLTWIIKLGSAIIDVTATNATALKEFNYALVNYSLNYENFTGDFSGTTGMSYIAKHSYIELATNMSRRQDAIKITVNYMRALESIVKFMFKSLELI